MNLQLLRRAVPALTIFLIALVLFILPGIGPPPEAEALYDACSRLAASAPAKALTLAQRWRARRPGSAAAKHCEALALFSTRNYPHAAEAFGALAGEAQADNAPLAARLFVQQAKAEQAAGRRDAAALAAAHALALDPANPEAKALRDALAAQNAGSHQ